MLVFAVLMVSFIFRLRCEILQVRLCEAGVKNLKFCFVTQGGAHPVLRDSLCPGLFYAGPLGRFGYPPEADEFILFIKLDSHWNSQGNKSIHKLRLKSPRSMRRESLRAWPVGAGHTSFRRVVRGLLGRLWDYRPNCCKGQIKYYVFILYNIIFLVLYFKGRLISGENLANLILMFYYLKIYIDLRSCQ